MEAISPPMDGVTDSMGSDKYLAYSIKPTADIKHPYRMVLPEKLYEFALMATIRPINRNGGYIFSVVNPLDTVVQLGIHLSPVIHDRWNISLIYTDSAVHQENHRLATFEIAFSKKWLRFAMRVLTNSVTFFHNCIEVATISVIREPEEFYFDSASTLYLAQAGPTLKGNFEVSKHFSAFYLF